MAATAVLSPTAVSLVNRALVILGDAPISDLSSTSSQARIASIFYQPAYEEFLGSTGWRWAVRTAAPELHTIPDFYIGDGGYTAYAEETAYVAGDTFYYDPDGSGTAIQYRVVTLPHTSPAGTPDDAYFALNTYLRATAANTDRVMPTNTAYGYEYKLPSDFLTLYRVEPSATHELATNAASAADASAARYLWSTGELSLIHYSAKVEETLMPPHAQECFVYKLAHLLAIPIQSNRARAEFFLKLYMQALRRAQAIDARQRPNASIVENGRLASGWDADV
jgi:hypothetical protein